MSVIAGNQGMLITMLVVLALLGLTVLVKLLMSLKGNVQVGDLATTLTRPLLVDVLPLMILSLATTIDPTKVIAMIWYYLAAVVIVIRTLLDLVGVLQRR